MSSGVSVRSMTMDDIDEIVRVFDAQDRAWWDEVDWDENDVRAELDRAVAAVGSLTDAARVCIDGTEIVGIALHVGHGQTNIAVDAISSSDVRGCLEPLVDWLVLTGATEFDSPVQDVERLAVLGSRGLRPSRSSFELERSAPLNDLGPTRWPTGIAPRAFRLGIDDEEVHQLIYSVWTDVVGHTHRPIDEWRTTFLGGPSFDADLVVLARGSDADGQLAGASVCRIFGDEIGWVSQLAVGREHRGLGLGRSLLVESLHRLASRGVDRFGLGVEAENAAALGLYRSVGLEPAREWVHCSRN